MAVKKIVIVLEGNQVSQVLAEEDTEVIIIDYDTEGWLPGEQNMMRVFEDEGIVSRWPAETAPERVAHAFKKVEA